jgi:hypothetical protein
MECSMSSTSESWSCTLKLRFDYGQDGGRLESPKYVPFVPKLTDKATVNIWLRRAQAAILSPNVPHDQFFDKTYEELRSLANSDAVLEFSKNVVLLDIKDPDATDLSFIDLPGILSCPPVNGRY